MDCRCDCCVPVSLLARSLSGLAVSSCLFAPEVFLLALSSGSIDPIGRLGGSCGVMSSRSAPKTFLSRARVLWLKVSWLMARSPCVVAGARTRTKVRMISIHGDGARAAEDRRQHGHALFGAGTGRGAPATASCT